MHVSLLFRKERRVWKYRKFPSHPHALNDVRKSLMHEAAISQDNESLIWHSSDYCLINVTLHGFLLAPARRPRWENYRKCKVFSIFLHLLFATIKNLFLISFYCFWHTLALSRHKIPPAVASVFIAKCLFVKQILSTDTHLIIYNRCQNARKEEKHFFKILRWSQRRRCECRSQMES